MIFAQAISWEINQGNGPFIPDPASGAPPIPVIIGMVHGGEGGFEYANTPGIFTPGWQSAPLDADGNLDFIQPSALSGFMTQLDFTYFQAFVDINDPSKPFILRYNAIDDGVIAYVFNEAHPTGIEDPNGGVRLYLAPKETDLSPLLTAGRNRIVLVQFDNAWTENYLNVSVIREEDETDECPTYDIVESGTNASCPERSDAVFFVQASCDACDNTDFTYSIDGGENFQEGSFFNLASGDYTVVIRNAAFPDCDQDFAIFLDAEADIEPPTIIECPEIVNVPFNPDGQGFINVDDLVDLVDAEDNCSESVTINVSDAVIDLSVEQITITVSDEAGNTSQCEVMVIVEQPCNLFITGIDATLGDCPSLSESVIVSTNNPGTILEYSIDNGASYQRSNVFENIAPGFYRIFVREVENPACITGASVTIQDGEDTISPDIILLEDGGRERVLQNNETFNIECSVEDSGITWRVRDNCDEDIVLNENIVTEGNVLEYQLTATDNSGNTTSRSITFIIEDTEFPTLICPDDLPTVSLDENGVFIPTFESLGVAATDNCGAVFFSDFSPMEVTETGVVFIGISVTDGAGNPVSCSFPINVTEGLGGDDEDYNINAPNTNNSFMAVYPNPVQDRAAIQFDLEKTSDVAIEIRNINGKLIQLLNYENKDAGQSQLELDFSVLATGIYFVSIKTERVYETTKIVVTN